MSDTARSRAWRQRLKEGGFVSMTIWVKAETKARYEALALRSHRSGSELAQLALAGVYGARGAKRVETLLSQGF